jgi:hypothetical protein
MKEPGLDNRHGDKKKPKAGEVQQKRADMLNKNLSETDSAVLAQRDPGDDAGGNGQDERRSVAESRQPSTVGLCLPKTPSDLKTRRL